ncbi:MAG: DUF2156 domain-containing protein [Fimbriimonadaceae bacterium]|nr:DUF2156 domain-containing protein [Fimbriimonadaceae bacterium]
MTDETTAKERAREIVLRHGWNATAYQIINPGFKLWFAENGESVVGYVERRRARIVAGGPICHPNELRSAFTEWERACTDGGYRLCYFGSAGRVQRHLIHSPGHSCIQVGSQPVWNLAHWNERTANHRSLRAQFARARNKGVTIEEWPWAKAENHPQLTICLDRWLATRGLPALHFLVEPDTLGDLKGRRLFVALREGKPVAFLTLAPVATRQGWLTEQFPRTPDAPNGTVELLMDTAARSLAEEGESYLTMGLVPLSHLQEAGQSLNPVWVDRVFKYARRFGSRFYGFDGLEAFKAKFAPEAWEPIYVITREPRFSAHSLYSVLHAFTQIDPPLALVGGLIKPAVRGVKSVWR